MRFRRPVQRICPVPRIILKKRKKTSQRADTTSGHPLVSSSECDFFQLSSRGLTVLSPIARATYIDAEGILDMSNQAINQNQDTTHLKMVFEQSLALLGERKSEFSQVRTRGVPLHIDPGVMQKRALDDAANALATLWRVHSSRARLRGRVYNSTAKAA